MPGHTHEESSFEESKEYLRLGNTIDFYEYILASLLEKKPGNVTAFCYHLVIALKRKNDLKQVFKKNYTRESEGRYIDSAQICKFLDQWVLDFLDQRPETDEQRMQFHEQYLKNKIKVTEMEKPKAESIKS